jgi:hypothetical protein
MTKSEVITFALWLRDAKRTSKMTGKISGVEAYLGGRLR